jgi:hypothetical protein
MMSSLLLDNGFLAYADESHIEKCLSADQYAHFVEVHLREIGRKIEMVDRMLLEQRDEVSA